MKSKGFTLIELLIVVAIIAILAAIAVPNFLEAQTRAKVSRQYNNLRMVATGIEAYAVDNNVIPLCTHNGPQAAGGVFGPPPSGSYPLEERWKMYPGYVNRAGGLTTPIAYLSSDDAMIDIFRTAHNFPSRLANQIMYLPSNWYGPGIRPAQTNRYGAWVIRSAGPDTYYQNHWGMWGDYDQGGWNRASYDPTNGTISAGDIYRSQKSSQESHAG